MPYQQIPNIAQQSEHSRANELGSEAKTTRVEDRAYSLIGIFDVNMPLLYGEGSKAFMRLQHEIVRQSTDKSILAWSDNPGSGISYQPVFAPSPNSFAREAMFDWFDSCSYDDGSESSLTNRGLHLRARYVRVPREEVFMTIRAKGSPWISRQIANVDICFLLLSHSNSQSFDNSLVIAVAERLDYGQQQQFTRICIDGFEGEFKKLFALDERELQPSRPFFIDARACTWLEIASSV